MRLALEETLRQANPERVPAAVAVGTFDGVHLGHRKLISAVRDEAERRSLRAIAVTFRQQPRSVVRPEAPFSYLCGPEERFDLLRGLGMDAVCVIDFNESVRRLTAMEFLSALGADLSMRVLVMGARARQGHDQLDAWQIKRLSAPHGFDVNIVEPAVVDGVPVSSSAIRASLAAGNVEAAAVLLGRPFALTGPVLAGDRRGRELGFPTANLGPFAHATVPKDGIYATWAVLGGERRMAATSIGVRPTFGRGNERRVEAYILDFSADIYGRQLRLEFVRRLRDEVAYSGPGPLVDQINKDVAMTRHLLQANT